MVEDTPSAWEEIYSEERRVLIALDNDGVTVGRGLRVFLWRSGDMQDMEISVPIENREIFRWLHDEFIDSLDELMTTSAPPFTGPASSSGFGFPPAGGLGMMNTMYPPPRRVTAARKTPALPLFAPKKEGDKILFLKSIAHELFQCSSVEEAKSLLAALMMGNDGGYLVSELFLGAKTTEEVVGSLLMECEEVESMAALRVRIFSVRRKEGETLLEFIDRVNESHRLFTLAFPHEPAQEDVLLAHIYESVLHAELSLRWVFSGKTTIASLRRAVRGLRMGAAPRMQVSPRTHTSINAVVAGDFGSSSGQEPVMEQSLRDTVAALQTSLNQIALNQQEDRARGNGNGGRTNYRFNRYDRDPDRGNNRGNNRDHRNDRGGGNEHGGGRGGGRNDRGGPDRGGQDRGGNGFDRSGNGNDRGGGNVRRCFLCQSKEHVVKDCPQRPVGPVAADPGVQVAMVEVDPTEDYQEDF